MLRLVTDGKLSPDEAVRAYHGVLQGKGIRPHRPLDEDLKLTDQSMSYDGSATRRSTVEVRANPLAGRADASRASDSIARESKNGAWPKLPDGRPDFDKMNPQHRSAYHAERLNRVLG